MRGVVLLTLAACAPDLDTTRAPDPHTFGERVVTLMCKRLAWQADPLDVAGDRYRDVCDDAAPAPADAPATLLALTADRAKLVRALDAAVPADFTGDLQAFLGSNATLALYDDGTLPAATASLADLLDELAADDAAMAALARRSARDGYRPGAAAFGIPAALTAARTFGAAAPSLHDVLATTIPAITPGGVAHGEWDSLVAALSATLGDASPADRAADRPAALAAQLLLSERAELAAPAPLLLVRRDPRGIAQVVLAGGAVPPPFADANNDRLADVDALGRFVDAHGAPLAVPAPFAVAGDTAPRDPEGRVALYGYVDVEKTVVGALGRDAAALFDPQKGTAIDLLRGASALLGARVTTTHAFGNGTMLAYRGYDTTTSPLLDMAYGWTQLLRDPDVRDLLALADTLVADHEPATARLVEAAITAARTGDLHPEAQILGSAPLWDDLLPVVRQIVAKPQLVRALLVALQRPEVKDLATRFSELMTYADRFDFDPAAPHAVVGTLATRPDRTKPDNAFNRSLWQRLLHLINDSNHAQLCNKSGATVSVGGISYPPFGGYAACDLIQIDNVATFFVRSIAYAKDASGNVICEDASGSVAACTVGGARPRPAATLVFKDGTVNSAINLFGGDAFLESQSTITGFRRHPTPEGLSRVLFLDPTPAFLTSALDPARDKDGDLYKAQHAGTLAVWEKTHFYDAIRPIAQAFVDNGSEQQFVDLLAVLHKHWPSKQSITTQTVDPAGPNYVFGSDGKSWEPLLADAFATDLVPALVDTSAELTAITVNGKSFATVLANAAAFAIDPLPGLTDRSGRASTTTADGRPVPQVAPWHVLADAYRGKQARLAEVAGEGTAWTRATANLTDVLLRAQNNGTGWKFRDARVRGVVRAMLDFVRTRLDAHDAKGDRTAWLAVSLPTAIHDVLTHPVVAGIADVATSLSANPDARHALDRLLHDAFDDATSPALAAMLRLGTADLVQLVADDTDVVPLAHAAGALLAPGKPYLATQLDLLQKLSAADAGGALVRLGAQLFAGYDPADPGAPAIGEIASAIADVDRGQAGTPCTAADHAAVLHAVAGFLREEQRGFPRFVAIVKGRNE